MATNPRSTVRIARHPLHPLLVILPIGCWIGAFVTDLTYVRGGAAHWAYVSTWLILGGLVTAAIAGAAGLIDFLSEPRIRALRAAWWHLYGNLIVFVLAIVDFMFHFRDGAAAVLDTGIILSGLIVVLLGVNGWLGGELIYRHRVGVLEPAAEER